MVCYGKSRLHLDMAIKVVSTETIRSPEDK